MLLSHALLMAAVPVLVLALQTVTPPKGFTALYNGRDLTGWRGGDTYDHRKWLALPDAERATLDADWTADMRAHWRAEGPELVNDGNGKYATTVNDYGDFELLVDYKTVPRADSGIYLRGCPQVQIWDHTNPAEFKNGADKGSGGLWNNSRGAPGKDPLVLADKPFRLCWGLARFLGKLSRRRHLDDPCHRDGTPVLTNRHRRGGPQQPTRPVNGTLASFGGRLGSAPSTALRPKRVQRLLRRCIGSA